MLKVLCLILLTTYRRFVLSALALLILQFIESPTFNYSQTAAGFFFFFFPRDTHVRDISTYNY